MEKSTGPFALFEVKKILNFFYRDDYSAEERENYEFVSSQYTQTQS